MSAAILKTFQPRPLPKNEMRSCSNLPGSLDHSLKHGKKNGLKGRGHRRVGTEAEEWGGEEKNKTYL